MTFRAISNMVSSFYLQYFKRKTLFIIGTSLMSLGNLIAGISLQYDIPKLVGREDSVAFNWLPIMGIGVIYYGMTCGQYHVILSFQGELLPSFGRAIGSGFVGVAETLVLFSVGKFLPDIEHSIGLGNALLICSAQCIILMVFVWFLVPETKGKTLEEIEEHYRVKCYGANYDQEKMSQRLDQLSAHDAVSLYSSRSASRNHSISRKGQV